MLSDWFLSEVKYYIAKLEIYLAFKKLHQMFHSIASIPLWRLILLGLKRLISLFKASLKYFLIDLPVPVLGFFYLLHFGRAILTLIDFIQDKNNKNLVELTKLLYACFKIIISLLMIGFLVALFVLGMAPVGLATYEYLKILFRIYTFSKFAISLLTLGFSYYKTKSYSDDLEYAWLKAHYRANTQKHMHILVLGTAVTAFLTVASVFGWGLGPVGLAGVILLAGLLLLVDIAKAIYFHRNPCCIPETFTGLAPLNSFIDFTTQDYYYRKCRTARLRDIKNPEDSQQNKIYLIKEIMVKILLLQAKLENCSSTSSHFFSEKPKIQKKIVGLKHAGSSLLSENDEENQLLFKEVIKALEKDYNEIEKNKTLIDKIRIENFINDLKESKSSLHAVTLIDELLHAQKTIFKEEDFNTQQFKQSFFRNLGDCEDIARACQAQKQNWDEASNMQLANTYLRS